MSSKSVFFGGEHIVR